MIDADAVEQDFDGAGAECGLHLLDLAHLFSGVDVDRAAGGKRDQVFDLGQCCGAKRVRRDADVDAWHGDARAVQALDQARERINAMDKAALPGFRCAPVGPSMRVEHRQERQAQANGLSGGDDAAREFGRIGVGSAPAVVVQVVEFDRASKTGFGHFEEGLGCDRLHIVGVEQAREAIHHVAPGPELVGAGGTLGEPSHTTLERVRVQVANAGYGETGDDIGGVGAGFYGGDAAIGIDGDGNAIGPAVRRKCALENDLLWGHGYSPCSSVDISKPRTYRQSFCNPPERSPCAPIRFGSMPASQRWRDTRRASACAMTAWLRRRAVKLFMRDRAKRHPRGWTQPHASILAGAG